MNLRTKISMLGLTLLTILILSGCGATYSNLGQINVERQFAENNLGENPRVAYIGTAWFIVNYNFITKKIHFKESYESITNDLLVEMLYSEPSKAFNFALHNIDIPNFIDLDSTAKLLNEYTVGSNGKKIRLGKTQKVDPEVIESMVSSIINDTSLDKIADSLTIYNDLVALTEKHLKINKLLHDLILTASRIEYNQTMNSPMLYLDNPNVDKSSLKQLCSILDVDAILFGTIGGKGVSSDNGTKFSHVYYGSYALFDYSGTNVMNFPFKKENKVNFWIRPKTDIELTFPLNTQLAIQDVVYDMAPYLTKATEIGNKTLNISISPESPSCIPVFAESSLTIYIGLPNINYPAIPIEEYTISYVEANGDQEKTLAPTKISNPSKFTLPIEFSQLKHISFEHKDRKYIVNF